VHVSIAHANSIQTALIYNNFGRVTQTKFPSSLSQQYHVVAGSK
jgi:hypothetical protein